MGTRELHIDAAYAGLPELAHGGYVAGVLTAALEADSTRVRLRRPVPVDRPLRIERPGPGHAELHDGDDLLAEGVAADVLLHLPAPVGRAEAAAATARFPAAPHHPVPTCLVCGTAHEGALGIFPGPVSGRALVAASWTPAARHARPDGTLPPELVAAALDCPQLWALMVHAEPASSERVVTSQLETRIERPVRAGEPHVVIAWPMGRDGRRHLAGAAITGPDGELCAAGRQTAVAVSGWGVPLGRDHWSAARLAGA